MRKYWAVVLEVIVAFLMYVSTYQAVLLIQNNDHGDIVRPLADTIFQSLPVLALIYFLGATLIIAGNILKRHNVIANGLLFGVFIFSYTAAVESYLVGFSVDTIDVAVLTLLCVALYVCEKRRYRRIKKIK